MVVKICCSYFQYIKPCYKWRKITKTGKKNYLPFPSILVNAPWVIFNSTLKHCTHIKLFERAIPKSGVAVVWKQTVTRIAKPLLKTPTIVAVELTVEGAPVLVISVYMPCRGYSDSDTQFRRVVDQLQPSVYNSPISVRYSAVCLQFTHQPTLFCLR